MKKAEVEPHCVPRRVSFFRHPSMGFGLSHAFQRLVGLGLGFRVLGFGFRVLLCKIGHAR